MDYEEIKKNLRKEAKNPMVEAYEPSPPEATVGRIHNRLFARTEPVNYRGAEQLHVAQAYQDVVPYMPQEDPALRRAMEESMRSEERRGEGVKSAWIKHIKAYQAKHGCSYKEAMKGAAKSYTRAL